jgi:hypothetical protein
MVAVGTVRPEVPFDDVMVRIQAFHAGWTEQSISRLCGSYADLRGDMALFPQFLNDITAQYYFLVYHEVPRHYLDPGVITGHYGASILDQRWQSCCDVLEKQGLRPKAKPSWMWIAILILIVLAVANLAIMLLH